MGHTWGPVVFQSFDNTLTAMGALFELSTTEGWLEVMYAAVDATAVDMQPIRDSSEGWAFFFMFYIIVGSFFVMNLFVGVVIDNFNTMKEKLGGSGVDIFMTESQKQWVRTQKLMMKVRPTKTRISPKGPLRAWCYGLVTKPMFDYVIMGCIIANTIVMGMRYFGQSHQYTMVMQYINYGFAVIFTVECILKLLALGCNYFSDNWNIFDFTIVIGTLAGIIVKAATGISVGSIATVVRAFRIGRLFRLIKGAKSIRKLFNTLIATLPSLGNISMLLALLFFIYAVMGVQLFAKVKYGDALNEHANFRTFFTAALTLMRSSTGENWNGMMYDMANTDQCSFTVTYDATMCGFNDKEGCTPLNGCGSKLAFAFFMSFTLFLSMVMLNLFIAVILEGFGNSSDEEEASLSEEEFEKFKASWSKYDPKATCMITTTQLQDLFQYVDKPLGFGKEYTATTQELSRMISELHLPVYLVKGESCVHFQDVVHALALRIHEDLAMEYNEDVEKLVDITDSKLLSGQASEHFQNRFGGLVGDETKSGYSVEADFAAQVVQAGFRAYRLRRNLNRRVNQKAAIVGIESNRNLDDSYDNSPR
jgi:hypothetical protein